MNRKNNILKYIILMKKKRIDLRTYPPQDTVSNDKSRAPPPPTPMGAPGFSPFRWSPCLLRGMPFGAWDAASPFHSGGGGIGPPMLAPFFRLPTPSLSSLVTDLFD